LRGEAVRVALAGVDHDRDRTHQRLPAGDPAAGIGAAGGLLRLPEDRLAALHLREHELGAGKPGAIEQQVDRRAPPSAQPDRRLFDDLSLGWPAALEAVAVHARGRRPRLPRLQHQSIFERKQQQVRQLAVGVRVTGDEEGPSVVGHAAAA
jgi:hypothetical protein